MREMRGFGMMPKLQTHHLCFQSYQGLSLFF